MYKIFVRIRKILHLVMFMLAMFLSTPGVAQENLPAPKLKDVISETEKTDANLQGASNVISEQKKLVKVGPDDEYDRGVPRNSVAGYFHAVKNADLAKAAHYLDLRNMPRGYQQSDGTELARQLKVVLDRSLWVDMDLLSTEAKGHANDGLPTFRDLLGQIEVNARKYDILLQRIPRNDGVFIWKFSSKTVRDIPELYNALGYGPFGEKLSEYFPDYELLGLQIWQWMFFLLIVVGLSLATLPFVRLASWLIGRRGTGLSRMSARFINGPVYVVLVLILTRHFFDFVRPSITARAIFEARTILIIALIWLLFRLVNLFQEYYALRLRERNQEHVIVLLGPALTALKILMIFVAALIWLDNIGFSVTTVLAGLGIGGIAIALATQKSIENFIGALTLYMAAPVKLGDFCRFGNKRGVIEEIGLRATKVRTLEDTVVIVPNAEFVVMQIENLTERNCYRFNPYIRLHFETSADQIRYICFEIQKLLQVHNKVSESPLRVHFTGFGEHSLDVEIHCYINTTDFNEFKGVSEELSLGIMDIIQSAGTRIAIPANDEYRGQTNELSEELKQQAKQQVESFMKSRDNPG